MAANKDVLRATDDEARALAVQLIRATASASLASVDGNGFPFASLTSVGTDADGQPVILVSRLSSHTGHLLADPRCSLLFSRTGKGDPLAHPRITVLGEADPVERDSELGRRLRRRFLARQPKAELYVDFPDFLFLRIRIRGASLNGGFGKAYALEPADLTTPIGEADDLIAAEADIIAHMNEDHSDAVRLYATVLAKREEAPWRMVSCDPEGFEIAAGTELARIAFADRVNTAEQARLALIRLAKGARAGAARQP